MTSLAMCCSSNVRFKRQEAHNALAQSRDFFVQLELQCTHIRQEQ